MNSRLREGTYGCRGKDGGGGFREFGMDMYALLYLKWITDKDLLYSKGIQLNVMWQPGWEGSLGGEWIQYMHG